MVRFLVGRLSELPEVGKIADIGDTNASLKAKDDFKGTLRDATGNDKEVRPKLKDLKLKTEVSEDSNSDAVSHETRVENVEAFGEEQTASQRDEKHISEHEQKLLSLGERSSRTRCELEKLRIQEKVLMKETRRKNLEAQNLEEIYDLLKAATEMAFDDQHSTDFNILQLNEQIEARRRNLVELELQRDTFRKPMEDEMNSLEKVQTTKPEGQNQKETELELLAVLSETKKRDEEIDKLSAILDKHPKVATRSSYIQRITEITKNSRKQDADIERILKETRELQLESNSIQERLHRTYAVVDELVFREAKKDSVARQAYRLLTSIHESFSEISEKTLATDRTRREIAEYEAKLAGLASRSLNVDKLQADLDAIEKENKFLEERLHGT